MSGDFKSFNNCYGHPVGDDEVPTQSRTFCFYRATEVSRFRIRRNAQGLEWGLPEMWPTHPFDMAAPSVSKPLGLLLLLSDREFEWLNASKHYGILTVLLQQPLADRIKKRINLGICGVRRSSAE